MWWRHKGECATLRGKISTKILIKHEIKRKIYLFLYIRLKYISFVDTIYNIFTRSHSWKYCIWCSLGEIYFNLVCKINKYPLDMLDNTLSVSLKYFFEKYGIYLSVFLGHRWKPITYTCIITIQQRV
jgi:hypothetical protein